MNVSRNMLIATIVGLLATALLAFVAVGETMRMETETGTQQGKSIARGAMLYDAYCSDCHGAQGQGLPGFYPTLNIEDLWSGREDINFYGTLHDYVYLTISAGHPERDMPMLSADYGGLLRDDQIEDLTQFILNWMGPQPAVVRPVVVVPPGSIELLKAGDPLRGEESFGRNCAGCHSTDASGGPDGPSLIAPQVARKNENAYRRTIIQGRPGTPMVPWAWDEELSPQDVDDLVAFIRSRQ